MPKFGSRSLKNLSQVDPVLQVIMKLAIKEYDFTVICGHRGKEEQNKAYDEKKSQLQFPKSKHNSFPSMAVDIVPYPKMYKASKIDFFHLAGIIQGIVSMLNGWSIRWGGDWDDDKDFTDQTFNDYCHFELIKEK